MTVLLKIPSFVYILCMLSLWRCVMVGYARVIVTTPGFEPFERRIEVKPGSLHRTLIEARNWLRKLVADRTSYTYHTRIILEPRQ